MKRRLIAKMALVMGCWMAATQAEGQVLSTKFGADPGPRRGLNSEFRFAAWFGNGRDALGNIEGDLGRGGS